MEEKKDTVQYTFGPDEKEILMILATFEQNVEEKFRDINTEIRYYNNFLFNGQSVEGLDNIFIVIEKDENGSPIRYNIYTPNLQKILSVDSEGQLIQCLEGLEQTLGTINIMNLISENEIIDEKEKTSRLKGISEKATPDEMQKTLAGEEYTDDQEQSQDEEIQKMEDDLHLNIGKYRKIKDSNVSERMPEVFSDDIENGIAFSRDLNRFVIISKQNGHYQLNENVKPARMTWKTIISIDSNGEKIERKVPHALMRLPNNSEKEIAVTLDQYGDPDIETVDVLSAEERIARSVRVEGENLNKEENNPTKADIQGNGIGFNYDISIKIEELEEYGVKVYDKGGIDELQSLNIEELIEEEADRVKVSKYAFKGYVKNAQGKTLKEKINNAQEEIIEEYKGNRRPR